MVLDISRCKVTMRIQAHNVYPRILHHVFLDAVHPTEGKVGSITAFHIDRDRCAPGDFLEIMSKGLGECSAFAFALFDGCGRLKARIVEDEHSKRNGVWGQELDGGAILYVLDTQVPEKFDWGAVTSFLLRALARSKLATPRTFFLSDKTQKAATYPLHSLIASFGLGLPMVGEVLVQEAIQGAYLQDPTSVRKRDCRGFSPLHVAAYAGNVLAARTLLGLPVLSGIAEDVRARDNVDGRTPLEFCEDTIRDSREKAQMTVDADAWSGHGTNVLRIIFLLKKAAGEHIGLTEDEFVAQRRWGCTCGQCTAGWLSPKMRYRLFWQTKTMADAIDRARHAPEAFPLASDWPALSHIPPEILKKSLKSFYRDYAVVMRVISRVLARPGSAGLPTAANVCAELYGKVTGFFANGCGARDVMDFVLHSAMKQSPRGDGTWDQLQGGLATEGRPEAVAYVGMPACDNDLDFARVAEKLELGTHNRYRRRTDCGRHNDHVNADDNEDEDEDQDEDQDECEVEGEVEGEDEDQGEEVLDEHQEDKGEDADDDEAEDCEDGGEQDLDERENEDTDAFEEHAVDVNMDDDDDEEEDGDNEGGYDGEDEDEDECMDGYE
ncbi:hypothetical protein ONZ51_g4399 [Trametes cubensis]|uniref:Uncharacterized protein n=1 Tax=Trametes cubensis TaxID=1111947 RepID=A0AAD7TWY6_9APHY|nr:hypothetical protein ONZ51_g4399 [Trametes cubensis]